MKRLLLLIVLAAFALSMPSSAQVTLQPANGVTGGGVVTAPQVLAQTGTCAAPSYSFASATNKGMHGAVAGGVTFCVASSTIGVFAGTGLNMGTLNLGFAGGDPAVTSMDTILTREGANYNIWRNGTNAQRMSVANTYTSSTNFEMASIDWQTTANTAFIGTRTGTTGTARGARFSSQDSSGQDSWASFEAKANTLPFLRLEPRGNAAYAAVSSSGTGTFVQVGGSGTSSATSGSVVYMSVLPIYNQAAATTANTDFLINRTETSLGSGTQNLIDAQVASASKFRVDNTGQIVTVSSVVLGAASSMLFTGRSRLTSNNDGLLNALSNAGSVGAQWNVGTADVTVTSCGTGTVTAGSRNTGGQITATGATACTVTFASPAWTNTPFCVATEVTAARALFISAASTTAITISGLTAGDVFNYICVGRI